MKKILLTLLSATTLLSCSTTDPTLFFGNWIEVMPVNSQFIQGVTLNADGTAKSIGMATLLYERWDFNNNKIILWGKSIGNGQTIDFCDSLNIIKITPDSLILGNGGMYQIDYYKVAEIPVAETPKPFNVQDSLVLNPDLGDVITREYQGTLPAADCPGIDYTLILYSQQNSGDGVYQLTMKYLERDVVYTTYGRQYTLRGDATDKNATVYQLVEFGNEDKTNFLVKKDGNIELINKQLERAESKLNYTLKLK